MSEKLNIKPLLRAYETLIDALEFAKFQETIDFPNADNLSRSAAIHNFEYTYELSWKMMKKFLEITGHKKEKLSIRRLFEKSVEVGLIDDVDKWMEFREARNLTSHKYDEDVAEDVFKIISDFDPYVQKFISNLNEKIKEENIEEE